VKAQGLGCLFQLFKFIGMNESLYRQVIAAGLEILSEGQHLNVVSAQVLHDFDNFVVVFAKTQHQARLGWHLRVERLEFLQQPE